MGNRHPLRLIVPTVLAATLVMMLVAACGGPATPAGDELSDPSSTLDSSVPGANGSDDGSVVDDLSDEELAAILAASAERRVLADNSFGGGSPFDHIDVVETVGATGPDGFLDAHDGRALTDAEREAIATALAPLPVGFVPATVFADLDPMDDAAGRAIVTLAEPAEVDGRLVITSQLWCGGLCAIGGANQLVRAEDGTWTVGEPAGPQWIS